MNRILIDRPKLARNLRNLASTMRETQATWTLVTKVLCGHRPSLELLHRLGIRSVGDTRLDNLRAVDEVMPGTRRWYLRPPNISQAEEVVASADVSLNSELEVLRALNAAAAAHGIRHRAVIMVELGELREGVLPSALVPFAQRALALDHIDVVGIGANLGCLSGTVPTIEQLSPLPLFSRLLEHEFGRRFPLVSAGTSVLLAALQRGNVPDGINHYRIGEAAFLGTDLIRGGLLEKLHNVVRIEAEIVEIKEKNLVPLGETSDEIIPFGTADGRDTAPGERGYRALVSLGHLDTDVGGLTPEIPDHEIVGGSSDLTVVYLGQNEENLGVGDTIRFRPDYSALLRAMNSRYMRHEIVSEEPAPDREVRTLVRESTLAVPETR